MANTKITNPDLFNLGDSTSATQLPVMTTTQRIAMNAPPSLTVDYLVVAGGGGGGAGYTASTVGTGGGGGAGGLITNYGGTSLSLNTSTAYTITVGDGGNGGAPGGNSFNGGDSTFSGTGITTIQAAGGGRGGMYNNSSIGGSGGSGGGTGYSGGFAAGGSGNTPSTTPSQGNDGGDYYEASPYGGGGGGGAGSAGSDGPTNVDGGSGVTNSITGTSVFYAAGGGGGKPGTSGTQAGGSGIGGDGGNANSLNGTSGATNTGSGGGGAGHPFASGNNSGTAGNGGSGIVILRYPTADVASYTATGLTLTETTDGVDTVLSFTTVGTGTITFTSSTPTGIISTGEMIFNSTTDKVEYWDGTKWYGITYFDPTPPALATSTVYLDASNTNSYPGTGSTWFDISGNSHNGAISGAQFNSQGWFDFDGSNDTISIPHSSVLNAQTFSVGGWFYPEYTGGRWLFTKGGPSDWEYGASATTGSSAGIGFATWLYGGGQVGLTWTDASITANTWHHVIVTVDRVNVSAKLYVNGGAPKVTDTSFTNHQTSSRPLLIGKRNDIGTYFDGRNSKFNFWSNQVLTQEEVQQLYDAGH